MHYTVPIIKDLSEAARSGKPPKSCISGSDADIGVCSVGFGAYACISGADVTRIQCWSCTSGVVVD